MDSSTSLPNDDAAAGGSPTGRPSRRTSTGAAWAGGPPAARPSGTTSRPRENRWRHVPRPGQQGGHGWIAGDTALPAARPGTAGPGRIARSTSPPEGRGGRGRIAGSTCLPGRRGQAQLRREDPPASRAVAASILRRRPPSPARRSRIGAPISLPAPPASRTAAATTLGRRPAPPLGTVQGCIPRVEARGGSRRNGAAAHPRNRRVRSGPGLVYDVRRPRKPFPAFRGVPGGSSCPTTKRSTIRVGQHMIWEGGATALLAAPMPLTGSGRSFGRRGTFRLPRPRPPPPPRANRAGNRGGEVEEA